VAALTAKYETKPEALQGSATAFAAPTRMSPRSKIVASAQRVFSESFFPEMKADWRAYPDNKGHKEWPGCFRCHDGHAHHHRRQTQRSAAASATPATSFSPKAQPRRN
jgi:hypothetical protein